MADETQPSRRTCATMAVHLGSCAPSTAMPSGPENENHALRRAVASAGARAAPRSPSSCTSSATRRSRTSPTRRSRARSTCSTRTSASATPTWRTRRRRSRGLVADARRRVRAGDDRSRRQPTAASTRPDSVDGFGADDAVKSSATGGADAWPPTSYLNLWVCPLGGGLLGYAQFPGGPAGDRRRRDPALPASAPPARRPRRSTWAARRPTRSATG